MDLQNARPAIAAPSRATMLTAKQFAADLLQACEAHDHLLLDLSEVDQADLSFVQIIHAARHQMHAKGGTLAFTQPAGEYLADLLRKAGLSSDNSDADFWFKGAISS